MNQLQSDTSYLSNISKVPKHRRAEGDADLAVVCTAAAAAALQLRHQDEKVTAQQGKASLRCCGPIILQASALLTLP
ncbi:hypothetical protein JOB18_034798 [Solea senegalensis]|uniref:Uncharacterized protein n=1 Tax=Solea senegalensis TaxID=28829 RepID=A0AAV6QGL5_SOLSE|nr:hypothetical protein JOB18_034798 [Solea senegalensis]